jgi:glycosyltransferase involved in cell wall biosynthesis
MGASSLRICQLGKFYPPATGGIEMHVRTLAQAQAALGMEVQVVCINHLDRNGRDVTWDRFAATETVEELDGSVRVTRVGRRACIARLDVCPRLLSVLAGLMRSGTDVLHLHAPNPATLLALAALRPRIPLVVTYHGDVVKQKVRGMIMRPFEHMVFRRATVLLSDSPTYPGGSAVLRRYQEKLAVLPLGIQVDSFLSPTPAARKHAQRLQEEYGEPLWLAVGRLIYYKGLHNAIRALASVPGKLMVIGHGPLESELKQLAEEVGVAGRIIWRGQVSEEELVGAYHAATALWFPSNERSEGFGLVQVEAMASGCPVINTAIPFSGVSWVCKHEKTGLTVPMNDPAALAAAARRLLDEPGLRDRMVSAGREEAAAQFDHRVMAERSLMIYHHILRNGSARKIAFSHGTDELGLPNVNGAAKPLTPELHA